MVREPAPLSSPGLEILQTEGDPYDGVLVNAGELPVDTEQFSERLQHSLQVRAAPSLRLALGVDKAASWIDAWIV